MLYLFCCNFSYLSASHSRVSDTLQPHGLYNPWNSPGQNTGAFPSPGDLPNPGIEPTSPILQADSLPAEPQGNPSQFLDIIKIQCCWEGN